MGIRQIEETEQARNGDQHCTHQILRLFASIAAAGLSSLRLS
jgi:hypothetical protein